MKLIVGLGNPGTEYQNTRHNAGFMTVDKISRDISINPINWQKNSQSKSLVAKTADIILAKPQTYVNKSGFAVKAMADFYKLEPDDIWVIYDDIDLPPGKIRIRAGGSSGGHNGVESVIKSLKTDKFIRFRLGIGRGKDSIAGSFENEKRRHNVISFVLSKFKTHEERELQDLISSGAKAIRFALKEGIDRAMNRFN